MMQAARITGTFVVLTFVALAGTAASQVPNWPQERPPRPLPARDVKFPPYQFRTLPNGLQVIAVSHHEQPVVSLRLIIRAGAAQDPDEKPGVARLASALLDQGTTFRDAEQIANTIDSIGGLIGTGAGTDLTFIQSIVMKDSFALALDLVSDIARNPGFDPEEIDRQRQQMLSGLKVSYDDPNYIAGIVFDRLVYGFHPYGRPSSGTPQTIANITRDDLVAFHRTWFSPNNAILAIVGDVAPEEAFAGAERAFGQWERLEIAASKPPDVPPPTRRVVVIDRPGAVQTEIRAGNVALPRKHPDYLALDLAMKILGGEGGNRLHRVLRSERGLTYGASADFNAYKDAGHIIADTDTRSDTTAEALRLLVDEISRLQRQRVQPRELADAQAYLTGNFPLTIETPSAIAQQVLYAVFYGLDLDELETYRERVNAVTPDDIQRVAREHLRPDRLSIVLVGDASIFGKQLPGIGFDQFERIPLSELDLASADLRRRATPTGRVQPGFPAAPPMLRHAGHVQDAVTGPSPQPLIDRAVRAKGGLDRLRSIRTVKAMSTAWLDAPDGRLGIPTTTWIRYPDSFRVDAEMPTGVVSQVFAGGAFWVSDRRGAREAPAAIAAEMMGSIQRDSVNLLLALARSWRGAANTSVEVAGIRLPGLVVGSPDTRPLTVLFDPETWLIARQRYSVEGPDGATHAEEMFSDYREIDGLMVAFRAVLQREGAPRVERILRSFEVNVPIDPKLFTRPS